MRLRSGLLIGIFGLIVVLLGGWFFTLSVALLTYLALLEFFRMAEYKGIKPATKTTIFSCFIIIIFTYLEKIDIDRFNWIKNQSLYNKDLVNFNIRVI